MKTRFINLSKFNIFFLIIGSVVFGAGCQKDKLINNLSPFKIDYYVQNENGQKVNQIKEGEKIYFYLSIENTSNKEVFIINHHLFVNNELFNIYQSEGKNKNSIVGPQPKQLNCLDIMGCYDNPEILVPWTTEKDTIIGLMCCSYELMKQQQLPVGKYHLKYTGCITYYFAQESYEIDFSETGNYNIKYEFEIVK